jgi:hypothetical protein
VQQRVCVRVQSPTPIESNVRLECFLKPMLALARACLKKKEKKKET